MRICIHCILPETFPAIFFDSEGVCDHCLKFRNRSSIIAENRMKYEMKFRELLKNLGLSAECRSASEASNSYDILMAYSGGKDSTYTMSLLRNKYKLRVLAVSFDNGFMSQAATNNIKGITDKLGIDHIFFKPKWELLKKIFLASFEREMYAKKTLERASTACTSCIGLVKSICLRMAIEKDIPMIGFGWSPGQAPLQSSIMKNNPSLVRVAQKVLLNPLREVAGDEMGMYFLGEWHYSVPEKFPFNVHPMAWEFYNEETIKSEIQKFGWVAPEDTDSNSSNCILNALANDYHIKRYGFHPYAWEIANMVREGIMTRQEGLRKIYSEQPGESLKIAKEKLEI